MKKIFENKKVIVTLRIIIGALFIYASFDKMSNPEAFADIIDNYHILPFWLVNGLAIFLPWLEFLTGFFLVMGKWVKSSLLIINILLFIFIIALTQALFRGLDISCGCFSVKPSSKSEVWLRIVEDIILLAAAYLLYKYYPSNSNKTEIENNNLLNQNT